MTTTTTGGAQRMHQKFTPTAIVSKTRSPRSPRPIAVLSALALCVAAGFCSGCAAPATQEPDTSASAAEPSRPQPVVTAQNSNGQTNRPAPVGEAATPLAYVEPQVPRTEQSPTAWSPDWFREGLSKSNGTLMACAAASATDLLDARRDAIHAATTVFNEHDQRASAVDRTVTRQLDDGRFRVWVRVAPEN